MYAIFVDYINNFTKLIIFTYFLKLKLFILFLIYKIKLINLYKIILKLKIKQILISDNNYKK